MSVLTEIHAPTDHHRGWPIAHLGDGTWAALDTHGRVLSYGSLDAVERGIGRDLAGGDP